jgi:hypothetical protein
MGMFRQSSTESKEDGVFVVCGVITQNNSIPDSHLSWIGKMRASSGGLKALLEIPLLL